MCRLELNGMSDIKRERGIMHSSWCGYIYTGVLMCVRVTSCAHHLAIAYLIVCNLCENIEGFLYIGLLLSGQKAVVLQDAELCVSARRLRL